MPTVAGFDFGGDFGYAITSDGMNMTCGTADLAKRAKRMKCSKASALFSFLKELYADHAFSVVVYENTIDSFQGAIVHAGKDRQDGKKVQRMNLGGALVAHSKYLAILELIVDAKQLTMLEPVSNMTLKKIATGSGRADKSAMLAQANAQYSLDLGPDDHNAADACHLAAWAYAEYRRRSLLDSATKKADI